MKRPILAALALVAALLACAALLRAAAGSPDTTLAFLGGGLAAQSVFLGMAIGGALLVGGGVRDTLGIRASRIGPVSIALAVFGFLACSAAEHNLITWAGLSETGSLGEIGRNVRRAAGPERGLALLVMGLAAGFAEELLFRGFVLRTLQRLTGSVVAVLGSSLLFGLVHADAVHSPAAFVSGLYLGTLAVISRSVWPSVAAHVANNALGLALLRLPGVGLPVHPAFVLGLAAIAGAVLGGIGLRTLRRGWVGRESSPGPDRPT